MRLTNLMTNHQSNPIIDNIPEFSWRIESSDKNVKQTSYRIVVKSGEEIFWDSGIIDSQKQSFILYTGKPLESRTNYTWSVEVKDNYGNSAKASANFETAFVNPNEWNAEWIESKMPREISNEYAHGTQPPPVMFTRNFFIKDIIKKARLYATAYGIYRVYLNETRTDDREFAPEHTVYRDILYYQVYDVSKGLHKGNNTLSFYVGDGWYHCPQTRPVTDNFHLKPALLYQLEIEYENGKTETVSSDGSELSGTGSVLFSDIFRGEKQDANQPAKCIYPVEIADYGYANLIAQPMPPVRPVKLLPAINIYTSKKNESIIDFGQIICGRARIIIDEPKGSEIIFEYFEIPDKDGNYLNTMYADQKDIFVSDGKPCVYEAMFTFHGFRYIKVTGITNPQAKNFTAVVLTTEKEDAGLFECSDGRLNRLYQNIRWSQINNMMSIPTDCPTREKAGFTGDIQIYANTAMLNEEMTPFLTSWLSYLRADQTEYGVVPMVVPFTNLYQTLTNKVCAGFGDDKQTGISGWGDAAVFVPYDMYQITGNKLILSQCYNSAKKWSDYIIKTAEEKRGNTGLPYDIDRYLYNTGFHFGEWLIPSQKNAGVDFEICKQSSVYTAPLFGYESVRRMAKIAKVLEKEEDFDYYSDFAEKIKSAIQSGLMADGKMPAENMGAYVLAVAFDLVPEQYAEAFAQKLALMIEKNNYRLDTGFLATPYLLDALDKINRRDLALKILWQDKAPSWLYQVNLGATAIWEDWNAVSEDGTPKITSYDHYAFGCVDDWIFKNVCGIKSAEPGFKHFVIKPDTDCGLNWCKRKFISEYGEISVYWTKEKLEISIPCNTTATVIWKSKTHNVGSGKYSF